MLANARKFIDSTFYKEIPFVEADMEDAFMQMMEDGLCVVAEVDGIHVGGVGAIKGPIFFNKGIAVSLERFLWVVPDERAGGIGKALLEAIEDAARKAKCDYLNMISLDENVSKIYVKRGFTVVEHMHMKRL